MTSLKDRIIEYIRKEGTVNLEDIERRARTHNIPQGELDLAITMLHRDKRVKTTPAGGTVYYTIAPLPKKHDPFVQTWEYPEMDETNDSHHPIFDHLTFEWLFMTPEEYEKAQGRYALAHGKTSWRKRR